MHVLKHDALNTCCVRAGGGDPGGRPQPHAAAAKVICGSSLSTGARASNNTQHVSDESDDPYYVMVHTRQQTLKYVR